MRNCPSRFQKVRIRPKTCLSFLQNSTYFAKTSQRSCSNIYQTLVELSTFVKYRSPGAKNHKLFPITKILQRKKKCIPIKTKTFPRFERRPPKRAKSLLSIAKKKRILRLRLFVSKKLLRLYPKKILQILQIFYFRRNTNVECILITWHFSDCVDEQHFFAIKLHVFLLS